VKHFPPPDEWAAKCEGWLQAALDASPIKTHTIEHVRLAIAARQAQLWPCPDAALVTELNDYPTGVRTLNYWLAGGNLNAIEDAHWAVEDFAEQNGCQAIEVRGRRGWAPVLKSLGFQAPAGTYFVKVLDDGRL
jgi:hypothetical protein